MAWETLKKRLFFCEKVRKKRMACDERIEQKLQRRDRSSKTGGISHEI